MIDIITELNGLTQLVIAHTILLLLAFCNIAKLVERFGKDALPMRILIGLFVIADWFVNIELTAVFFDLPAHPKELVTGRLQRYVDYDHEGSFKFKFAKFFGKILNKFDPGHIKLPGDVK